MALATLVKVSPMDTATGSRVDLYLSNVGDPLLGPKVNGLGGQVWVPAITNPPVLSIRTWNGDFTAAVEPGEARLGFSLGPVKRRWASVDSYHWAGAPIEVYAEEPGTAWPWTARFVGVVRDYGGTKRKFNLSASVDERRFSKNILTATYAGTGGIEGPTGLKGRVKPLLIGWATNVEPVLIDAVNNVYQFSGYGAIEGVTALYERGSPFPASTGDFASYTALVAASIPNGGWATCLASGLIRLGAPQFGVITGDVKGHKVGAATPRLPGSVISALATIAGVAAGDINTTSLTAFDTGVPYPINLFIDSQAEFDSVAKEIALTCNWVAGIALRGKFFTAPVSLTPAAALTLNAQGSSKPQVLDVNEKSVSLPYWKTIMGAQRSWRVHSSDEIAFQDGSSAVSGYLTKETTALAADSAGNVSDFSPASGIFKVFQGGIDRTAESTFSLVSSTGCTVSINAATGAYSVSAMTLDGATATFQAVYDGVTITKVLSLIKTRAGSAGSPGANASVLTLSNTANTFTYDNLGNASPASQTITFTANLQNLSGTVSFSATGYTAAGIVIGPITLSGSGNSRTMTNTQFGSAAYAVVTASLSGYSDTVTVVRLAAGPQGPMGLSPIVGFLTNEAVTLTASSDGTVTDFSPASGTFKVFEGTTDRTTVSAFSVVGSSGATVTINSTTGAYSVSDMGGVVATASLQAVYGGVTIQKVLSLSKSRTGAPGVSGVAAISAYLTNETVALFAYADGSVLSYAAATGNFKVFSGNTDVSSSFILSTNANPQALTVSYTSQTYSVTGGFDPSEDTATLSIRATGTGAYAGIILDKTFTLSKMKGGYEIVSALPTTNLFQGRVVYLETDDKLYRYTGSAWTSSIDGGDLIAGSIGSAALKVGLGKNILVGSYGAGANPNTVLVLTNPDSIPYQTNGVAGQYFLSPAYGANWPGSQWTLIDNSTMALRQTNGATGSSGFSDIIFRQITNPATGAAPWEWDVESGKYYEFSIYTACHRCSAACYIHWLDSSNSIISATALDSNNTTQTGNPANGSELGNYVRLASRGQAPANAKKARVVLRKYHTTQGYGFTDSWLFFTRPMFAETVAGATEAIPWSPSPITVVSGDIILAGSVATNHIAAGAITAAKLAVTQLSAITADIGLLRTATTGARTEIEANQIRVYDGTGTMRVRIGVWT